MKFALQRSGVMAAIVGLLLCVCLFGDRPAIRGSNFLASIMAEIRAACHDPSTQWMLFACAGIYCITFVLLEQRSLNSRFWRMDNSNLWLVALLVLVSLHYAMAYSAASLSTQSLVMLTSITIGKAVRFWSVKAFFPENPKQQNPIEKAALLVLVCLLASAALIRPEGPFEFQYRGQLRWTGPWDNPNVFGLLMGVGLVLAAGQLLRARANIERRTSNIEHRSLKPGLWRCLQAVFFLLATVVCGVGLVKSYSRGAWVGVAVGVAYLGWGFIKQREHRTFNIELRTSKEGADEVKGREQKVKNRNGIWWFRRNLAPLSVVALSVIVLAFWNLRHTEQAAVRRIFSAANVNDFSWRNRIAAWEGTLAMMADKPLVGFGWNQPERVYDEYYRAPKIEQAMAIQMNDYFILGTTLGIPALICFVIYVGLSLARSLRSNFAKSHSEGILHERLPVDVVDIAKLTCRAGAVVLLVGFWFDGGLFRLATGTVFWVLIELGKGSEEIIAGKPELELEPDAAVPQGAQ